METLCPVSYLCLCWCRPSGEKKVLEQKSSTDMNGYQIRVWRRIQCLLVKTEGTTHVLDGPIGLYLRFNSLYTLAYSRDVVTNWSPAAFLPKNKCLILLPYVSVDRGFFQEWLLCIVIGAGNTPTLKERVKMCRNLWTFLNHYRVLLTVHNVKYECSL